MSSPPTAFIVIVVALPFCTFTVDSYASVALLCFQSFLSSVTHAPIAAQAWSLVAQGGSVPTPRGGHSFTRVGNQAFLFGGLADGGKLALGDMHVLDLATFTWAPILPVRLHRLACVLD
jgi:hypothetical protein